MFRFPPARRALLPLLALLILPLVAQADYALVWGDEFNGTSLNTADWNYDIGDGCPSLCGWGNNELEYYRSQNVVVDEGHLTITAKQESYGGRYFTSGKIHTRNKHHFLYGRMEMRAKIPTGGGMWPAFWMMPEDDVYGGWAASGEIDIMEAVNDADAIHGTLHFGGSWPDNASTGGEYAPGNVDFGDEFHIYAVEWEPDEIRWYVDGILFSTKYKTQWYSLNAPGNDRAPFDQSFFLILNAAVGGNWPGCTNPGCITADLPQEYVIDYVRVYQESENEAPTVTITSPTEGDNPQAGTIIIEAEASDSDGSIDRIEFFAGLEYIGMDDSAPYSITWTEAGVGCHLITAKAYDDDGTEAVDTVDLTVGVGCGQAPYGGAVHLLPTRIEAEDFDVGGQGVAYHDLEATNHGGEYRLDEAVDIQVCGDTGLGHNVGWIRAGEWMEYSIAVGAPGTYTVDVRVACFSDPGAFRLEVDGQDMTGSVAVEPTGGWQDWETVQTTVSLTSGLHLLRFHCEDEGFNMNYLEFTGPDATSPVELPETGYNLLPCFPNPFNPATTIAFDLPAAMPVQLGVYDVAGRLVDVLLDGDADQGRNEVVWRGRDQAGRLAPAGVYFYSLEAGAFSQTRRMILLK